MLLKSEAFSLLEFLIVAAILVLVTSMGIGLFQKGIHAYQQKIFFNQIVIDIDQMRDQTRLDHRNHQIDFGERAYVIKIDSQIVKQKNYPRSLSLATPVSLAFAVTGVPKKSGTVTFRASQGKIFQVILAPVTGRVRWEAL